MLRALGRIGAPKPFLQNEKKTFSKRRFLPHPRAQKEGMGGARMASTKRTFLKKSFWKKLYDLILDVGVGFGSISARSRQKPAGVKF